MAASAPEGERSRPAGDAPGWRDHWYPVAFARDLGPGLHRVRIHGEAFVLFRDPERGWSCLRDRCPHRAARLSDGRLLDGGLECLYHGWQFSSDGACRHIPQLPASQEIPRRACVEAFAVAEAQGMVWIWPGAAAAAEPRQIPTLPHLDLPGCSSVDFAIELPYEQTFLIENVIDIAHIHIAHDGIRGGGRRELAAPIRFEVSEPASSGFTMAFKSIGLDEIAGGPSLAAARAEFRAPNLVHYESVYEDRRLHSGLALYSAPLGRDRCKLLYRAYSDFWRLRDRLRPRWLEHRTQCDILEQDMSIVVGQAAEIQGAARPPSELWLPLKTSDAPVIAYREWLDRYAAEWPYSVGFRRPSRGAPAGTGGEPRFDRHAMHTRICGSCSRAERAWRAARAPLAGSAVAFLALAAATAGSSLAAVAAGAAVASALGYGFAGRVAARFR